MPTGRRLVRSWRGSLRSCSPPRPRRTPRTTCSRAAQTNDATVALAAIEDGVDVNAKSPDGTTALHWAVYNGNVALVERLIAAGADVAAANEFGSTPLAEAATVGNAAIIEALLEGRRRRRRAGRRRADGADGRRAQRQYGRRRGAASRTAPTSTRASAGASRRR